MSECMFSRHQWEASKVADPPYHSGAMRCAICGVGYLFEIRRTSPSRIAYSYHVFPAYGEMDVSDKVVMWAAMTCQGSEREMRDNGEIVDKQTPRVGGPRPKALDRHINWQSAR